MLLSRCGHPFSSNSPAPCLHVRPRPSLTPLPRTLATGGSTTSWTAKAPAIHHHNRRRTLTRSVVFEGAVPEGVQVEVKALSEGSDVEWDPDSKTLRLPINVVEGSNERRTKLVIFTCNKCGGRTARNVNPIAWENGMVMGQCATCEVWHVLSAKNKKIFEEIRYREDPRYNGTTTLDNTVTQGSSDSLASTDSEARLEDSAGTGLDGIGGGR